MAARLWGRSGAGAMGLPGRRRRGGVRVGRTSRLGGFEAVPEGEERWLVRARAEREGIPRAKFRLGTCSAKGRGRGTATLPTGQRLVMTHTESDMQTDEQRDVCNGDHTRIKVTTVYF